MRRPLQLALLLLAVAVARPAAAGPWTSYARPYTWTSVLTQGDTVWCGTLEAGLLQYRAQNTTPDHFVAYRREPNGLSSNRVTALAMERSRRLWVGTDGGGISLLSADRGHWDLIKTELNSTSINALTPQGDSMWIATTAGIAVWDGHSIAGSIPFGPTDTSPFGDVDVTGIAPLGDSLWISNSQGTWVTRISTGFQSWSLDTSSFFAPGVQALALGGGSLFALSNTAVYLLDRGTGHWGVIGLAGNIGRVVKITGSSDGLIASTADGGVAGVSVGIWHWSNSAGRWDQVTNTLPSATTDPKTQFTTAVEPDGTILAADIQGIFEQATPDWILHAPISPPGNNAINLILQGSKVYVNALQEASFGVIGGGGVGRFDGTVWRNWPPTACTVGCDTTFIYPPFPFAMLVDRRGKKWDACWAGALEEFDDSISPPSFIHHYVDDPIEDGRDRHSNGWSAIEDGFGGKWFGMEYSGAKSELQAVGIDYYDANGNFVRNFRPDSVPSMRNPYVRALLDGTRSGGGDRVFVGELGGFQFVDLPLQPGVEPNFVDVTSLYLPHIQGLAGFGDSLWVLSDSDLRRYSFHSLSPGSGSPVEIFSIPGNAAETALHPLEVGLDGTLYIGSERGLRAMHPGGHVEDFNAANSPLLDDRVRAIRVDPRTGKVWIASGGGVNVYDPGYVPPGDTIPARLVVQAYPNPVMITALGVSIRIAGNAAHYSVDVLDVRGRRVRHLDGVANAKPFWNARDDSGTLVRPGIYFIRVETGGRTATARVALIR